MGIEDDIAFLERVPTLAVLGRDALRIIAIGAESRYVHDGVALFKEGEDADGAYVVQEGAFELAANGGVLRPVTVRAGALIGELALLTVSARSVTATAIEPSTVIRITRQLFLKMLEGYPEAARRMRDSITGRVNDTARELTRIRSALEGGAPQQRR